jgi:hypothetical protein
VGQKQLIHSLIGPHEGKPIVVICGGPSVVEALERIPADYPACVISANAHGYKQHKFHVDFCVHVDPTFGHTRQKFGEYLEQFGATTISRWSYADYRIPEYGFPGDSGMTALYVAALLGGHPIIPLGLDRMQGPKRYFWETEPEKGWHQRRVAMSAQNDATLQRTLQLCAGAQIRAAGCLAQHFAPWSIDEQLPPYERVDRGAAASAGAPYKVLKRMFLHPADPVDPGSELLLTTKEAAPYLRAGIVCPS